MAKKVPCPVCGVDAAASEKTSDSSKFDCPECGVFRASGSSAAVLAKLSKEDRLRRLADAKRIARPGVLAFIYEG